MLSIDLTRGDRSGKHRRELKVGMSKTRHVPPKAESSRHTFAYILYSLRAILLFANTDVSTTKICLDTSMLAKSIMGRRE
jgi:hypothetical protein